MSKPQITIIEGDFVLANRLYDEWAIDDGSYPEHCQRVTNGAALTLDGSIITDGVYLSRDAAERALDSQYQSAMDDAKRRSGAHWS